MGIFRKTIIATAIGALGMLGAVENASAHAHAIGYTNAGPGAVTVWLGTYSTGHAYTLEGGMNLVGVNGNPFPSTTQDFTILTAIGTKPAGLVDGVNHFYVSTPLNVPGPLVGSEALWNTTLCSACGPADHWQGATFAGLAPGDYQFNYVPIANPTAEWTPYNSSLNGIFTLTGAIVNPPPPIPEPETYALMLAGLGVLGAVIRRRKQAAKSQ